jgi:maltose O-acetyltransferase
MPSKKLKEKLKTGKWISVRLDETLWGELNHAYKLCQKLNQAKRDSKEYKAILVKLLGAIGEKTRIRAPFFVDYGYNIYIGKDSFINYNCVILDEARVEIGDRVWIGPGVHIYAVEHKVKPEERDRIRGIPVIIGDDVWIGGHATILPGIRIGKGGLIAAGAVVTKDVEEGVIVAGNPARKLRKL